MDDAARIRETARAALADVEPAALEAAIDERLVDASMAPAALSACCARAFADGVDPDAIHERAAGVQLIYEGLRLTRRLAHEEPWVGDDAASDGVIDADVDVLVADVMVSRGFYLLARTPAAGRAVDVVRSFGRDQTERCTAVDGTSLDRELEADAFALAAVAGATVADRTAPEELVTFAADLGRSVAEGEDADLPSAAATLDEGVRERVTAIAAGRSVDPDPVTRSATDS